MSKKIICPNCSSTEVAKILYGMPAFTPKLEQDLKNKKVILGGCVISDNDPKWRCTNCQEEWGSRFDN